MEESIRTAQFLKMIQRVTYQGNCGKTDHQGLHKRGVNANFLTNQLTVCYGTRILITTFKRTLH